MFTFARRAGSCSASRLSGRLAGQAEPEVRAGDRGDVDVLSEILVSMRLVSSVISRARFTAPWAVRTSGARGALFHVVMDGRCWLRDGPTGERIALEKGDLVLLSHGGAHVMCDSPSTHTEVPVTELTRGPGARVEHGGPGEASSILCGSFRLDHAAGATLLSALPPIVHVTRGASPVVEWFDVTLKMIDSTLDAGEAGSDAVASRLLDVLFVQLLRSAASSLPATGWLAAVRDPQVGRALALIHQEPGARWTVESLARRAGMSRSSFFERFTTLVGEPPAKYLARWRVMTGADRLRRSPIDLVTLATELGYASEDAFARTFKRHIGLTPREYRKSLAAEGHTTH